MQFYFYLFLHTNLASFFSTTQKYCQKFLPNHHYRVAFFFFIIKIQFHLLYIYILILILIILISNSYFCSKYGSLKFIAMGKNCNLCQSNQEQKCLTFFVFSIICTYIAVHCYCYFSKQWWQMSFTENESMNKNLTKMSGRAESLSLC